MARERSRETDRAVAQLVTRPRLLGATVEDGEFFAEIFRRPRPGAERVLVERLRFSNTVVDQGLNHKRSIVLLGGTQITTWYIMPISGTPTIANADTYASHAGWTEITDYDEATRETWTGAATGTAGEASNAAAVAEFTISAGGATVGGAAFVGGGGAASTKGDTAGGGTLLSAAAFTGGNRVLVEDDLLRITYIQRSSRP